MKISYAITVCNEHKEIEKLLGVEVEIYGFDSGNGLTEPKDFKDLQL